MCMCAEGGMRLLQLRSSTTAGLAHITNVKMLKKMDIVLAIEKKTMMKLAT